MRPARRPSSAIWIVSRSNCSFLALTYLSFGVLSLEETHDTTFVGWRGWALSCGGAGSGLSMRAVCREIVSCNSGVYWCSDRCRIDGLAVDRLIDFGSSLRDGCNLGVFGGDDWSCSVLRLFGRWACHIFPAAEKGTKDRTAFATLLLMSIHALGG